MPSAAADAKILKALSFRGHSSGAVKTLRGFKKSFHSLPDAVNAATTAFLGKLAAEDLAQEAEQFFQRAKTLLHYKRRELAVDITAGTAVVNAKDFTFEIEYSLSEDDPSEYRITRSLHSIRNADFLELVEADDLLAGLFSEVIFLLTRGAPVESVIDAIEGLDARADMKVGYPSDCSVCTISVPGVDAEVRYAAHALAIAFPRSAPPRELWSAFLAVRHAFALSKDVTLGGLVCP